MTVLECRHILPNGSKCRCPALRDRAFCLHHAPKSTCPAPPSLPKRQQYSRLSRWRRLGRSAAWLDPAEILFEILGILDSLLGQNGEPISDLAAGRYLRALLLRLGHLPFAVPGAPEDPAAAPPHLPAPLPAPEPARPSPPHLRPLSFRSPTGVDPAPTPRRTQDPDFRTAGLEPADRRAANRRAAELHAANVHANVFRAALDEAFPDGLPNPGQPIDAKGFEDLARALVRLGIVPPAMAPAEMSLKGRRP